MTSHEILIWLCFTTKHFHQKLTQKYNNNIYEKYKKRNLLNFNVFLEYLIIVCKDTQLEKDLTLPIYSLFIIILSKY